MAQYGTTFTIDTRDAEFAAVFKDTGIGLENPVELFGRKWHQIEANHVTGRDGFRGVYTFQRLEEVTDLSKEKA